LALQGRHVRAFGRRWVAPLSGRADWLEARGLHLRRYTSGQLDWEIEAEKASGRMVALEAWGDSIRALFSNGLLWVLDTQGRKIRELSLGWRGIDSALFFLNESAGPGLLSAFFPPGRHPRQAPARSGWVTFVLEGDQIAQVCEGIGLRACLDPSLYLTQEGQLCHVNACHQLQVQDQIYAPGTARTLLSDPRSPTRGLLALADPSLWTLSVQTPDGVPLWNRGLPSTTAGDYYLCGVLGSPGTPGEGLIGVFFETWHKERHYHSQIYQKHLWLLRMDGTLVGKRRYPPGTGRWINTPLLLLEDLDRDGQAELLVVEDESVRLWATTRRTGCAFCAPARGPYPRGGLSG
jgi:hypothetical protein